MISKEYDKIIQALTGRIDGFFIHMTSEELEVFDRECDEVLYQVIKRRVVRQVEREMG